MTWLIKDLVPSHGLCLLSGHRTPEVGRYLVDRLVQDGHRPLLLTLPATPDAGSGDDFAHAVRLAADGALILVAVQAPDPTPLFRFASHVISCDRQGQVWAIKGSNLRIASQHYRGVVVEPNVATNVTAVTKDARVQQ